MNSWLKVLDKLGSGTPMVQGYISTTRGLRLLGARARPPASSRAAAHCAGIAEGERGDIRKPQACS